MHDQPKTENRPLATIDPSICYLKMFSLSHCAIKHSSFSVAIRHQCVEKLTPSAPDWNGKGNVVVQLRLKKNKRDPRRSTEQGSTHTQPFVPWQTRTNPQTFIEIFHTHSSQRNVWQRPAQNQTKLQAFAMTGVFIMLPIHQSYCIWLKEAQPRFKSVPASFLVFVINFR